MKSLMVIKEHILINSYSVAHNELKELKLKIENTVVFDIKSILNESDGNYKII